MRVLGGSVRSTIRSSSAAGHVDLRRSAMSPPDSSALEAKPLLTGLVIGESPRWHEERLWFANWGTEEIVAVDLEGNAEVVGKGPPGLGWSIDWPPDGRLPVTGQGLTRLE